MKWLLILFLLPSSVFSQGLATNEKEYNYPAFRECGLVTRWASNSIPPNCLTEARNVYFDEDLSVYRRKGTAKYNNTPCTDSKQVKGMWKYNATDGQRYIVIFSSQSFFYTKNQGDCQPIVGLSNLNVDAEYECVQAAGQLYCTNGINPGFSTTVSTYTIQNTMPLGTKIGTFRNRIVIANAPGNLSRILLSGELPNSGQSDWQLKIPGVSTTPSSIDISGMDDGKPIKALLGAYQNSFYIGREDDLYQLSGNSRKDFTLRQVSSQIGVLESRSVKEKDNCLIWLSRRGVEKMCGTTIERASDPIRDLIDGIIGASGNTRTKTYNDYTEWEAGLYQTQLPQQGPTSTTIYPGSVVPSTWSHINDEAAHWNAGTFTNIDTTTVIGSLVLNIATDTNHTVFDDFSNGLSKWSYVHPNCSIVSGSLKCTDPNVVGNITLGSVISDQTHAYGSWQFTVKDFSAGGSVAGGTSWLFISTVTTNGAEYGYKARFGWLSNNTYGFGLIKSINGSGVAVCSVSPVAISYPYTIKITRDRNNEFKLYKDSTLLCSGTDNTFTSSLYSKFGYDVGGFVSYFTIDDIYYPDYFLNSSWISPTYDTTFSTPVGGSYYFDELNPIGSTITYQLRQSSTSVLPTWSSWQPISTTTTSEYHIPLTQRYWQEQIQLSTQYSTQTPVVNMTYLDATTTGYYIGDCANTSGVTSWGNFRPDARLSGNSEISYAVVGGQTCNEVTRSTANWTVQLPNAPIATSTAPFLGFRVFEVPQNTTDTLRLDSLTLEWNEGSERPPVASEVYKNRYYLFYTTSTASGAYNNSALVFDMNDKWSMLDDLYVYSSVVYENQLYTGDSRMTGTIEIQDVGIDDVGNPYSFKIKTSDYDLGNPIEKKSLKRVYLNLKSEDKPAQNINLTLKYYINGSTTSYSLNSVALDEPVEKGYFVAKFPAINSQPTTFNWISFSLEYDGSQGPVNLYGVKMVYSPIRWE